MKFAFSAVLAAVLTLGLAAVSFAAPGLTGVTAEGTVGSELTITGTELGMAAPKVALRLTSDVTAKPIPLKVGKQAFNGTTFKAAITKIQPGQYDLLVTPKGGTQLTLEGVFTARTPQVSGLSALKAALGGTIDINGTFFGTAKGKVTVNGVTAKVKAWADGKITIVISKKSGVGTSLTIDVLGKGGGADDAATIELVAPISGKDSLVFDLDNGGGHIVTTQHFMGEGGRVDINGSRRAGITAHILAIVLTGNTVVEGVYADANIGVTYTAPGLPPSIYGKGGAWTVTITQRAGDRVTGTFSGPLSKTIGAGPATYNVTGEFTLTIK